MKPLIEIESFLKRFDNFRDSELRSIEVINATTISVTLAGQDSARDFDWISVKLEFHGIDDAKLIETKRIPFIDMSNGITIINQDNTLAFGIDECYNLSSIKNSVCYILSSTIKYEEDLF